MGDRVVMFLFLCFIVTIGLIYIAIIDARQARILSYLVDIKFELEFTNRVLVKIAKGEINRRTG
jgi:hypothetical protein